MKPEISVLKKRLYAFTIDLGIVVVANYFFMAAMTNFVRTVFFHFPLKVQLMLISKMAVMSSISLMSFSFAYFSLFYFITNGSTMGKSIFGLRASNVDGEEMTLKQSMLRSIAYFTCAMLGSFLFALSWIRKDQKSLADIFSGTVVGIEVTAPENIGSEFQLTLMSAMKEEISDSDHSKAA